MDWLPFGSASWWVALIVAVIAIVVLYMIARLLMITVRLLAVLGLALIGGAITWGALTLIERQLGPSWKQWFLYRTVEPVPEPISITKIICALIVGFWIAWRLTTPK